MMKVALETVGCRLNQYETERIAEKLIRLGMQRVGYAEKADLYILNTCTVTGRADADCRKLINRACRLNNSAVIVMIGCYVVADPGRAASMDGVALTVGNDEKDRLPEILLERFPHLFPAGTSITSIKSIVATPFDQAALIRLTDSPVGRDSFHGATAPNRAMVKIGDGCNQTCAYCIVPKVRGRLTSRPSGEIIAEVGDLVASGYHEATLTAVHIGRYTDAGRDLAGLVEMILDKTGLPRLRLSSLEPNELDDRLLQFVAANPRVCRHLHLPLQSGSDRILHLMRRPYTAGQYLEVIRRVKQANEEITIGCDLIIGFPGETEDDFAQSLAVLNSGYIDYAHVFSYSDRPGTAASEMMPKIDPHTIKERNARAREVSRKNRRRQMKRQIGKVLPVISEGVAGRDGLYHGVSDNYIKVKLPSGIGGSREIIHIRVTNASGGNVVGEKCE